MLENLDSDVSMHAQLLVTKYVIILITCRVMVKRKKENRQTRLRRSQNKI